MKKYSLRTKQAYLRMLLFVCSLSGVGLKGMESDAAEEGYADKIESTVEENAEDSEKDAPSSEASQEEAKTQIVKQQAPEEVKEQTTFVTRPAIKSAITAAPATTQEGIKIGGGLSIDW